MALINIVFIVLVLIFQGTDSSTYDERLYLDYYKESCPLVEEIVRRNVEIAVLKEPRMAASLLRLHFHDCFVMGCDASLLLDSRGDIISEKQAGPNLNSLRGFEVIDEIKSILEEACPYTVSCADLLAIVARDAVELRGGPSWPVGLGRKDSLKASLAGANQYIPTPNSSLEALISNFAAQGLDTGDLVALSGSHTIGKSRCLSFKPRIYDKNLNEETNYHYKRNTMFLKILRSICPQSGRDNAVVSLDLLTPAKFDNQYYRNIIQGKGLLQSDNVLLSQDVDGKLRKQVWAYASDQEYYFSSFVGSMIKMGNINLLTGEQGEIRRNCRFPRIKLWYSQRQIKHYNNRVEEAREGCVDSGYLYCESNSWKEKFNLETLMKNEMINKPELGGSLPVENVQALASKDLKDIPARYIRPELESDVVYTDGSLEIPVIDLSRLLDQQFMYEELKKFHSACEDWGFFQLINHGVPEEVVEKMKVDVKDFFNLPLEEKKAACPQLPGVVEGYGQAFVVSEEQKLDWADMLFLHTQPVAGRNMTVWPKHPTSFRATLDKYSSELLRVTVCLIGCMAKNLGVVDPEKLTSMFEIGWEGVRMNYYPPCVVNADKVLGISPHSDAAALTLLTQVNEVQGLQIRKNGNWVLIKAIPGAFIVNIGDIIEIMSNGKYKSIEHRVVVDPMKERMSIAAFQIPQQLEILGPLPELVKVTGGQEKYKTLKYTDYLKLMQSKKLDGKSPLELLKIAQIGLTEDELCASPTS